MIDVWGFLETAKFKGVAVSPIVCDLLHRYSDKLNFRNIDQLDDQTLVGVLRAFRFSAIYSASHFLHDIVDPLLEAKRSALVLREALDVLPTLFPFTPEDIEAMDSFFAESRRTFPELQSTCSSCLLQIAQTRSGSGRLNDRDVSRIMNGSGRWAQDDDLSIGKEEPNNSLYICQIGDIHFGRFNAYDTEEIDEHRYKGPLQDLPNFLRFRKRIIPSFYVICGDIASDCEDDFGYFDEFILKLPVEDGCNIKDRVLIVPGNHDNLWTGANTDRLSTFRRCIADAGYLTPFGSNRIPAITKWSNDCPMSAFMFEEHKCIFLLVVSSFYTGEVAAAIRRELDRITNHKLELHEELLSRVRIEHGYLDGEYLRLLEEIAAQCRSEIGQSRYESFLKIAVIHHHLDPAFRDEVPTKGGIELRRLLKDAGFNVLLHGHIHSFPEIPSYGDRAQAIPCLSISGITHGSPHGFNILEIRGGTLSEDIQVYSFEEGIIKTQPKIRRVDMP